MSSKRYAEEFKIEAVKQITERRYPVAEVSARLGVSQHSLYEWMKKYSQPEPVRREAQSQQAELRRLQAELKRVTEERDILKKAAADSTSQCNTFCFNSNQEVLIWQEWGDRGCPISRKPNCGSAGNRGNRLAKSDWLWVSMPALSTALFHYGAELRLRFASVLNDA